MMLKEVSISYELIFHGDGHRHFTALCVGLTLKQNRIRVFVTFLQMFILHKELFTYIKKGNLTKVYIMKGISADKFYLYIYTFEVTYATHT
jgi:hypothetical protein